MKIKRFDGVEVDGKDVDFSVRKEDWSEYELADGTILKVKLVLNGVIRLEDYDPTTGDPIYVIKSQNVVRTICPEKLKKSIQLKKPTGEEIR